MPEAKAASFPTLLAGTFFCMSGKAVDEALNFVPQAQLNDEIVPDRFFFQLNGATGRP